MTHCPTSRTAPAAGADLLASEFSALKAKMRSEGAFEPEPGHSVRQSIQALAFLGFALGFASSPSWWACAASAAFLGLFYALCAYVSHDVAHGQATRSRSAMERAFLALSLAQGLSLQWWRRKHSQHHAHTNAYRSGGVPEAADGDIDTLPLLCWSPKLLGPSPPLSLRLWLRVQRFALWPLMPILRLQWIWHSLRKGSRAERVLIGMHLAILGCALARISPHGAAGAAAAVLGANALSGAMLCSFFLFGHSGMLVRDEAEPLGEFREQARTTRNFSPNRFATWLSGGLNYQIEHHLFPSLPRSRLPKIAPAVRDLAERHGEPYGADSLLESYARVHKSLDIRA